MEKKLIFIISLPRSGSTLLQRMLSAHHQVCSTSECWFLLPLIYMQKEKGVMTEYGHAGSYKAIQDLCRELPGQEDDFNESIQLAASHLYKKLAPAENTFFLDKTPRYYLIIPEILRLFPDAKFIFLNRNPLAILSSVIHTWCKGRLRLHRNYIDLISGPELMAKGWDLLGKDRAIQISYEDLLQDPELTMEIVCTYLDIKMEPEMLHDFNKVLLKGSQGDKSYLKKRDSLDQASLLKWRDTFNTRFRKRFALNYLNTLGESVTSSNGYSMAELKAGVDNIAPSFSLGIKDRIDVAIAFLIRALDLTFYRKKWQGTKKASRPPYVHY